MKKFTKSLNLKKGSVTLLQKELLKILREQFNFRMQLKLGQLKKVHILRETRRNIASIKHSLFRK